MGNLSKTLENLSTHIQELYKESGLGLPVITVSGSAAGIYRPELFGKSIFKKEVGDIDLSVVHPKVVGNIFVGKKTIIWMNSYGEIIYKPAAAYSLDRRISHYLTSIGTANKEARRMVEVTSKNLENYSHPFETYEELTGNFLDMTTRASLKQENLEKLKMAVNYTQNNLFTKHKNQKVTLHDLFKYLGSICSYWMFRDGSVFLSRRDAIEELSKDSKKVEECWYYIQRKWDEGEIIVKNPEEVEEFIEKCSKFLPK